jgi:hypothetical protein
VVDRPELKGGLHVPPAAFDLQQLLVAQGDVLRGQVRVRAAQQVHPVQIRLARDLLLVDNLTQALDAVAAKVRRQEEEIRALKRREKKPTTQPARKQTAD